MHQNSGKYIFLVLLISYLLTVSHVFFSEVAHCLSHLVENLYGDEHHQPHHHMHESGDHHHHLIDTFNKIFEEQSADHESQQAKQLQSETDKYLVCLFALLPENVSRETALLKRVLNQQQYDAYISLITPPPRKTCLIPSIL